MELWTAICCQAIGFNRNPREGVLSRSLKLFSGDDWNSASTLTMPFQAGGATAMTWFNANGMAANG